MHTIWILSLEPIETRYAAQWFAGVPRQIAAYAEAQGIAARVHMDPSGFGQEAIDSGVLNIVNVPGDGGTQRASAGAFLNFATTNLWKNQQVTPTGTPSGSRCPSRCATTTAISNSTFSRTGWNRCTTPAPSAWKGEAAR